MCMPNAKTSGASNMLDLIILLLNTAYVCNICTTLNFSNACESGIRDLAIKGCVCFGV